MIKLYLILALVGYLVCTKAQQTTDVRKKLCAHPMDVVFVLDGSDSVTRVNFDKVKKFTSDIIDEFDLSPVKVRVGVIEFSTFIGRVIELGQISSLPLLKFLISNISMSNDGTGTHKALKRMREMFQERGRPEVPRIGVVITDGLSVSPYLTKEEARLLHLDGVITFAVGIEGDKTFQTELEYIASRKENALRVLDFDALPRNLSSSLCIIAAPPEITTNPTSSIVPDRIGESSGKNDGYVDDGRHFQVHSSDCTKYVEVVPGVGGTLTFIKSCPFGLFWDEISLTCVNSTQADCFNEPCRRYSSGYTYPMDGICSGFWTCFDRKSLPACCTMGHMFEPGRGCVTDPTCVTPCPPRQDTVTDQLQVCKRWANPNDSRTYLEEIHNRNISRPCAPGSSFDQSACGCTHHVTDDTVITPPTSKPNTSLCRDELYLKFNKGKEGNVNGFKDFSGRNIHVAQRDVVISALGDGMMKMNGNSSCLNIWRFSNIEYRSLMIYLKFIAMRSDDDPTQTKYQVLLSNCYYKSCSASVAIVLDRINHVIGVQTQTAGTGSYIWWHPVKYQVDIVNNVTLSFDHKGTNINFSLNKQNRKQFIQEMVLLRQTGIVIGAGGMYNNFKGYIDQIRIHHCNGDPPTEIEEGS
ncbi:protein PIF-like isoform X1 [Crassostrea angulata]|uniref:protein PIF-like isoform X1 n=1 Tax=Magallana angulata TaxID=2784310 RepID=UPI0022B1F12C|nr:protein PIF-like isoform X1 [Crassostrea angulata]